MGSSIKVKWEPAKKYKQVPEKRTSEPMKSPYGVGIIPTCQYLQLDPFTMPNAILKKLKLLRLKYYLPTIADGNTFVLVFCVL